MEAVELAVQRGAPPSILAGYDSSLCPWASQEELAAFFRMLHHAGIGQFRLLEQDAYLEEAAGPIEPVDGSQTTADHGIRSGFRIAPFLSFALREPQFISAVRLKFSYRETGGEPVLFRMFWKNSRQNDFSEAERSIRLALGENLSRSVEMELRDKEVTIWINDVIDEFRVYPDIKPCSFEVSAIRLLVAGHQE
jgi:hypothetical protein